MMNKSRDKSKSKRELSNILKEGFGTWSKNLNIAVPFILSSVLTAIMIVIVVGAGILVTGGPSLIYLYHFGEEVPAELIPQLKSQFMHSLHVIISLLGIIIALGLLINAYFTAGAIGMVKEATKRGRTSISDMLRYGSRNFIQLLFAEIIVALIATLAFGIAFLIPVPEMSSRVALLLMLIALSYIMIVSIIFALVPYAVVIGGRNAIAGVGESLKLFKAHKLDVFLLWLIVIGIGAFTGFLLGFMPHIIGQVISIILSVVIIQPLAVTWWSKLYMQYAGDSVVTMAL